MSNRYLLIGASSGIGLTLANHLLAEGHIIHALSRTRGQLPEQVDYYACDICAFEQPLPPLDFSFDGLVYLPGSITLSPFTKLSLTDFKKDIDLNYLGAVRAIQEYHRQLTKSPNSSIVFLSSVAAKVGMPFHTSIGSAKAAIEGLTLSLAAELAPNIRVNAVAPSLTDSALATSLLNTEVKRENAAKRHPMQAIGKPIDTALAIAYLLSEAAKWVTGQIIHVDGGFSTIKVL